MRKALTVALAPGAAPMASGLTAGTALADTGLELVNETTGTHCGSVSVVGHEVSGGCELIMTSEAPVELEGEVFGFHVHEFDCNYRFDVYFDEAGSGYLAGFQIANCTAGVVRCTEGDGSPQEPPRALASEEVGPSTVETSIDVCIETATLGRCSGAFDVTLTETNEAYEAIADGQAIGTSPCELDGHWLLEEADPGTTDVHINHL